jgi:hypothetical protein
MEERLLKWAPVLTDDGGWRSGDLILDDIGSETELYLSLFRWAWEPGQREYAFWKLAEMWWLASGGLVQNDELEWNPWTAKIIQTLAEEKLVAIGGSANSTKSRSLAAWGVVSWMCDPEHVLVLFTSTSITDSKKRIWGAVDVLLTPLTQAKIAPTRIRSNGSAPYNRANGTIAEYAGLFLIAGAPGKERESTSKLIGVKASPEVQTLPDGRVISRPRLIIGADELSELSPAIVESLQNLQSQDPLFAGLSNPGARTTPFAEISEPEGGWGAVDLLETDEWRTKKGGKFIRFDGHKSPNVLARETIYPYLPTLESLAKAAGGEGGENSLGYLRFIRATFFASSSAEGVYNLPELRQAEALIECGRSPQWREKTVSLIAACDPSEGNDGDNFPLMFAKVGYLADGRPAIEFLETDYLYSDDTNLSVPRTFQIARKIKEKCEEAGIPPQNFVVDDTMSSWADVLVNEWGHGIYDLNSNSRATDRPAQGAGAKPNETNDDKFVNRTGELWFAPKALLGNKQIFNLPTKAVDQMVTRGFQFGKSGVGHKLGVEPKKLYRARVGSSPDEADCVFLLIDLAVQRFGLLPTAAKSEKEAARMPDARFSDFGWLEQMILNPETMTISTSGAGWAD